MLHFCVSAIPFVTHKMELYDPDIFILWVTSPCSRTVLELFANFSNKFTIVLELREQ